MKYLPCDLYTQCLWAREEEREIVLMWLPPYVSLCSGYLKVIRRGPAAILGGVQSRARVVLHGNAPLVATSRLPDDTFFTDIAHIHTHTQIHIWHTHAHILIFSDEAHTYTHKVHASAGQTQGKKKKQGTEGPFFIGAVCTRVCMCVLVWVCLHLFGVEYASLAACLQFKQASWQTKRADRML